MRRIHTIVTLILVACSPAAFGSPSHHRSHHQQAAASADVGMASWYGSEIHRTATGRRYDPESLTAAHRNLPFGTRVLVTRIRTNASVIVSINNRGPFTRHRIIDLSRAAARRLGILHDGVAMVRLTVLPPVGEEGGLALNQQQLESMTGIEPVASSLSRRRSSD